MQRRHTALCNLAPPTRPSPPQLILLQPTSSLLLADVRPKYLLFLSLTPVRYLHDLPIHLAELLFKYHLLWCLPQLPVQIFSPVLPAHMEDGGGWEEMDEELPGDTTPYPVPTTLSAYGTFLDSKTISLLYLEVLLHKHNLLFS